jgi:hypothetical protein
MWRTSVISATQEMEVGGLQSEASLGKTDSKILSKNKQKQKVLGCG